jgi:CBS domain-containing protein
MKNWTVDDVMTVAVVSVDQAASYRSVVDTLIERRFSAVPVVDDFQRVIGVVSEADLLRKIEYAEGGEPRLFEGRRRRGERVKAHGRTAADLMSAPVVTVLSGTSIPAAARKMDAERVKRLPVIDDLGRLVGVVTRGDLLKIHLRPDEDIRADVAAVLADTITVEVTEGVTTLGGHVRLWSAATESARLAYQIPGVVEVVDKISFDVDDSGDPGTGIGFGSA